MGSFRYYPIALIVLCVILFNISLISVAHAQTTDSGWILLGTDPDEGLTFDLKEIYYKVDGNLLYIKVVFYRPYYSLRLFDIHIYLDVDDNTDTGVYFAKSGIGADYALFIGNDAYYRGYGTLSFMVKYTGRSWDFTNIIYADYEYYAFPSDTTIVCYDLSQLEGVGNKIRAWFIDTSNYPIYDYFPDSGNIVINLLPEKLLEVSGISTGGFASLSLQKDSGTLKITPFPWLGIKNPYEFNIIVLSVTRSETYMIIDIQINYNIQGWDNWLPAKIIVDYINGKIYLIGPINMIGSI